MEQLDLTPWRCPEPLIRLKLWLRQAVNRIMHPGAKGDYVLILEGTQGLDGKDGSTAALVGYLRG